MVWRCGTCNKSFEKKNDCDRHSLIHTNPAQCSTCKGWFKNQSSLLDHKKTTHDRGVIVPEVPAWRPHSVIHARKTETVKASSRIAQDFSGLYDFVNNEIDFRSYALKMHPTYKIAIAGFESLHNSQINHPTNPTVYRRSD